MLGSPHKPALRSLLRTHIRSSAQIPNPTIPATCARDVEYAGTTTCRLRTSRPALRVLPGLPVSCPTRPCLAPPVAPHPKHNMPHATLGGSLSAATLNPSSRIQWCRHVGADGYAPRDEGDGRRLGGDSIRRARSPRDPARKAAQLQRAARPGGEEPESTEQDLPTRRCPPRSHSCARSL
jgi:hypothetical protein